MKLKMKIRDRAIKAAQAHKPDGVKLLTRGLRNTVPPFTAAERNKMVAEANAKKVESRASKAECQPPSSLVSRPSAVA